MISTQLTTLAQLLRQPASKSQPIGATVSDCLDACIPVYSFAERPVVKTQRSKLPRVESLPAVPDFYEQYERCVPYALCLTLCHRQACVPRAMSALPAHRMSMYLLLAMHIIDTTADCRLRSNLSVTPGS